MLKNIKKQKQLNSYGLRFSDDMKPSRKYASVASCLLKCECKNEDCYYGNDPCACNLSSPCLVNFTMNRTTGGEMSHCLGQIKKYVCLELPDHT